MKRARGLKQNNFILQQVSVHSFAIVHAVINSSYSVLNLC